ncbi:DUF6233 domain-containing protein [Streptomyces sp. NPDC047022]|uniref:DUF6233 domain-containing protein n=1 Tax=Streptomyces sp. NPDC047022 TaxID=3155737 RepID=UPI0033E36158
MLVEGSRGVSGRSHRVRGQGRRRRVAVRDRTGSEEGGPAPRTSRGLTARRSAGKRLSVGVDGRGQRAEAFGEVGSRTAAAVGELARASASTCGCSATKCCATSSSPSAARRRDLRPRHRPAAPPSRPPPSRPGTSSADAPRAIGPQPSFVHLSDCRQAGKLARLAPADAARNAIASGLEPCPFCRPDTQLGLLD